MFVKNEVFRQYGHCQSCLIICGWIIFRAYQNAGIEITIYFEDASGITPVKTQAIARGIPVGIVRDVKPDIDKHRIRTTVKMDKVMDKYLVKDTVFWVVRPELSAARIYGLETILSGSYIGIQTGASTDPAHEFTGLSTLLPSRKLRRACISYSRRTPFDPSRSDPESITATSA